jgi:hypothetical protein
MLHNFLTIINYSILLPVWMSSTVYANFGYVPIQNKGTGM